MRSPFLSLSLPLSPPFLCALVRALCLHADFINLGNRNKKTALMFASQLKRGEELVAYLLSQGADPNVSTRRGHTAIVYAAGVCSLLFARVRLHGSE